MAARSRRDIGEGGGCTGQNCDHGAVSLQRQVVVLLVIGPAHVYIACSGQTGEPGRRRRNQQGAAGRSTGLGSEDIDHAVLVGRRGHSGIGVAGAGRGQICNLDPVPEHHDAGGWLGVDPCQHRIGSPGHRTTEVGGRVRHGHFAPDEAGFVTADSTADLVDVRSRSGHGIDVLGGGSSQIFQDGATVSLQDDIVVGIHVGPGNGHNRGIDSAHDVSRGSRDNCAGAGITAVVVADARTKAVLVVAWFLRRVDVGSGRSRDGRDDHSVTENPHSGGVLGGCPGQQYIGTLEQSRSEAVDRLGDHGRAMGRITLTRSLDATNRVGEIARVEWCIDELGGCTRDRTDHGGATHHFNGVIGWRWVAPGEPHLIGFTAACERFRSAQDRQRARFCSTETLTALCRDRVTAGTEGRAFVGVTGAISRDGVDQITVATDGDAVVGTPVGPHEKHRCSRCRATEWSERIRHGESATGTAALSIEPDTTDANAVIARATGNRGGVALAVAEDLIDFYRRC